MTQLEFLEEGFKQELLCLEFCSADFIISCNRLTCDTCEYFEICSTIKCGIKTHHPELFQQFKDKCPHLFI